jgi:hypothetical protein
MLNIPPFGSNLDKFGAPLLRFLRKLTLDHAGNPDHRTTAKYQARGDPERSEEQPRNVPEVTAGTRVRILICTLPVLRYTYCVT